MSQVKLRLFKVELTGEYSTSVFVAAPSIQAALTLLQAVQPKKQVLKIADSGSIDHYTLLED